MKNFFKTLSVVFILIFVSLIYGINASLGGYQLTLFNFVAQANGNLPPDFSYNISSGDQFGSVIYIALFLLFSFMAGKKDWKNCFSGIMIYSALPFIGLLGYFFIVKGMKAGIISILSLIWSYPYFPLLITESSVSSVIVPILIAMVLSPVSSFIAYKIGKNFQ